MHSLLNGLAKAGARTRIIQYLYTTQKNVTRSSTGESPCSSSSGSSSGSSVRPRHTHARIHSCARAHELSPQSTHTHSHAHIHHFWLSVSVFSHIRYPEITQNTPSSTSEQVTLWVKLLKSLVVQRALNLGGGLGCHPR